MKMECDRHFMVKVKEKLNGGAESWDFGATYAMESVI